MPVRWAWLLLGAALMIAEVFIGSFGVLVNVVFRMLERRVLAWPTSVRREVAS